MRVVGEGSVDRVPRLGLAVIADKDGEGPIRRIGMRGRVPGGRCTIQAMYISHPSKSTLVPVVDHPKREQSRSQQKWHQDSQCSSRENWTYPCTNRLIHHPSLDPAPLLLQNSSIRNLPRITQRPGRVHTEKRYPSSSILQQPFEYAAGGCTACEGRGAWWEVWYGQAQG